MKRIIALFLALTLALGLSGCSDYDRAVSSYKNGNYEKALERFEKLGNTDYIGKCRFMLLYEYILKNGNVAEDGNYTIESPCIAGLAYIYLSANPKNKEQLQIDFAIAEDAGEALESYEILMTLSVDNPSSAYQITQSTEDNNGEVTLVICNGTMDAASYTPGTELDYTQCQRTTLNAENSKTTENVNRTTRKKLFTYFNVAIDGLYETLVDLDIGTTTKDLGFTQWRYVTTQ